MGAFVAIDFETANHRRDSACALGLAVVEGYRIRYRGSFRIRPLTSRFDFTRIHGIRWSDVQDAPSFAELWPTLSLWVEGADFLAAHNAAFDRSVLHQCCAASELPPPQVPFVCTVEIARELWGIFPTRLPEVCRRLNIPLVHHDAQSDAVACGRIVLAAMAEGWRPRSQVRSAMANDCDRGFV